MESDIEQGNANAIEGTRTLEALFLHDAAALRGKVRAMTRDPEVAEDVVSEAFLRLAIELEAGRAPRDPRAWLYRVGANLVVSRARHAAVATRALPGLLERDVAPSPEETVIARERDREVRNGLATLVEADREMVILAASGYRPEEIARLVGRSGPATRTRLCRARARLRDRFEGAGMTA